MASYPAPRPQTRKDSAAPYQLLALFLGIVVVFMGSFGLWLALSAQHARDDANKAASQVRTAQSSAAGMSGMPAAKSSVAGGTYATPSFAGAAPANADALAMRHAAFP